MPFILLSPNSGYTADLSPSSAKECAICHLNWIDVFYREGVGTELVEYPQKKVVADEMMCYSCHDGSVNDSRFRVWETNRHKPGIKPSNKVKVPQNFPLDRDGGIQCATCHTAHGVDSRPGIERTIFLRVSNTNSDMCRMCHAGKDRGPEKGSHPVDVTSLEIPPQIIEAGGKTGSKKNQIICQTCHNPHGSTSDKFLIIPNSGRGVSHSALCETCHTIKPDIAEKSKMRKFSHPVDIPLPEGADLPERWGNGEIPYLSEDGLINCRTCHSPHNAASNTHLLTQKNEKEITCLICHVSKKPITGSKHDMDTMAPDEKNVDGKTVSVGGVCSACHFMHKGTAPKMWARPVSGEGDTMSQLCYSCHAKDKVGEKKTTGEFTHPVDVYPANNTAGNGLPLFDNDLKKDGNGKVTCASCHNPHQWDPVSPDARAAKTAEGDATNSFLRKRGAPLTDLCVSCHDDKKYVEKTTHDMSMMSPKSKNIKGETVKTSGICGACHLVHNAKGEKLWARTKGLGKDAIERLCNGCHTRGSVAGEKLLGNISHPLGVRSAIMTSYAGILPFYDANGKKTKDGFVTCSTCHDVHQWNPAKHTKGAGIAEGDRFDSFLRIAYDDDASLCANCHNKNSPVKDTKHDLKKTAPDEKNAIREQAQEGAVCSSCHLVHKATGPKLWARAIEGKADDIISMLCQNCHAEGKVAEKKRTGHNSHPIKKRMAKDKPDIAPDIPLYTKEGNIDNEGYITCATCHNPHQWDPQSPENKGSGIRVDGNGATSFLRRHNTDESLLCVTCHAEKRYVYKTEHDIVVGAPELKNTVGKTVSQSGVCSACHLVHNSMDSYKLWALELGDSNPPPMNLCLSCHKKGGAAERKVPKYLTHPSYILAMHGATESSDNSAPLYDKNGKETLLGYITCPTCHNAHKWSYNQKDYGTGKNTEGSSINSFLRTVSSDNICKNCHGIEGLIRYKFYHTDFFRDGKGASPLH